MKNLKRLPDEPEIELRRHCVALYQTGKSPTEIQRLLNRSRPWVYKWLNRYKSNIPNWYLDQSKAPRTKPQKIDRTLEGKIVLIRQELVRRDKPETRYAYHGAVAIHQKLDELGYDNKPHISTINRVLKRNGLIADKPAVSKSNKSKIFYPDIMAKYPGHVYELDLVTPRYITNYGRIVSVNRVDIYSGLANLNQYDSKGAEAIIEFIISDWKINPKPIYLKLDNEASFRGSVYHKKSFGKLTRFCLNFGVQLIFIPFNEPWRNSYVESFNSRFNEMLWLSTNFNDLEHLRRESIQFRDQHNQYQVYKKANFGNQKNHNYKLIRFPKDFEFSTQYELPITKGQLHFIRWVNEKGVINILNEKIPLGINVCCEYVWCTIDTNRQSLSVYYKATYESPRELIRELDYKLRETAIEPIPVREFCKKV